MFFFSRSSPSTVPLATCLTSLAPLPCLVCACICLAKFSAHQSRRGQVARIKQQYQYWDFSWDILWSKNYLLPCRWFPLFNSRSVTAKARLAKNLSSEKNTGFGLNWYFFGWFRELCFHCLWPLQPCLWQTMTKYSILWAKKLSPKMSITILQLKPLLGHSFLNNSCFDFTMKICFGWEYWPCSRGLLFAFCGMLNEYSVWYFQCRTSRHALASIARVRPAVFITSVAREIARYNNLAANAQVRGHSFAHCT